MSNFSVFIDGVDYTSDCDDFTFANVARGGFESAQLSISNDQDIRIGATLVIYCGLEIAWYGRINSPGTVTRKTGRRTGVVALGHGVVLKEQTAAQLFVDRDLTQWQDVRGFTSADLTAYIDTPQVVTGREIKLSYPGKITNVNTKRAGVGRDFNREDEVARVYCVYDVQTTRGNVFFAINASETGVGSSLTQITTDTFSATGTDRTLTASLTNPGGGGPPTNGFRYVTLHLANGVGADWTDATDIYVKLKLIAVYGNTGAGLPLQGIDSATSAKGFYVSDIARWAILQSRFHFHRIIDDAVDYILPHAHYPQPVPLEQIVSDMANFVGWVWGTWEPIGMSNNPTFRFQAPPKSATIVVSLLDCEDIDEPVINLDRTYNTAEILYNDASGQQKVVTTTLSNPVLDAAGIPTRTMQLSMGTGTGDSATAFGTFALRLAQAAQRGGGSVTLPNMVKEASGGTRPSCLVRAGRDRVRIPELNAGNIFDTDTRAQDTFLVERVETTVSGGRATTKIEFDGGADLMEVLQARMQVALTAGGLG